MMKNLLYKILSRSIPLLPAKLKLPFRYWIQEKFDKEFENELRYLQYITNDHNVAIDIGANVGLFSYKLASYFSKVYAFEINEGITSDLATYNSRNINIINAGLSSVEKENVTLYIPVLNGLPLAGWASLRPNNHPDAQSHLERKVKIFPLDKLKINPVSFIKIDVEGHEVDVLKGAIQTITSNRPVILIEVKEENIDEVQSIFSQLNYKEKSLMDIIGKQGMKENHIFIPN